MIISGRLVSPERVWSGQIRIAGDTIATLALVEDHGCPDDIISGPASAQDPFRRLGVGVEFPQQLGLTIVATISAEAVNPSISSRKNDLWNSVDFANGR